MSNKSIAALAREDSLYCKHAAAICHFLTLGNTFPMCWVDGQSQIRILERLAAYGENREHHEEFEVFMSQTLRGWHKDFIKRYNDGRQREGLPAMAPAKSLRVTLKR